MVRRALSADLEEVLRIYASARGFMAESGNPTQWGTTYPPLDVLEEDIKSGNLYVCEEEGRPYGVFAFIPGDDPTYAEIEDGKWPDVEPYWAVHRVASDATHKGVFWEMFDYCRARCMNIRMDTHHDNLTMQRHIERAGFVRCGVIHVEDGSARIAYQWKKRR